MPETDCIEICSRIVSNGETHEIKRRVVPECNRFARFARGSAAFNVAVIPDQAYKVLEAWVQGGEPGELADLLEASPVLKGSKNNGVYIEA